MKLLLELLADQEADLIEKLCEVRERIEKERLNNCFLKYGIKYGSVVKDQKGVEHRVIEIDLNWDRPWLSGNPKKKDGTFGVARRNLYSYWELVSS